MQQEIGSGPLPNDLSMLLQCKGAPGLNVYCQPDG